LSQKIQKWKKRKTKKNRRLKVKTGRPEKVKLHIEVIWKVKKG